MLFTVYPRPSPPITLSHMSLNEHTRSPRERPQRRNEKRDDVRPMDSGPPTARPLSGPHLRPVGAGPALAPLSRGSRPAQAVHHRQAQAPLLHRLSYDDLASFPVQGSQRVEQFVSVGPQATLDDARP